MELVYDSWLTLRGIGGASSPGSQGSSAIWCAYVKGCHVWFAGPICDVCVRSTLQGQIGSIRRQSLSDMSTLIAAPHRSNEMEHEGYLEMIFLN